VQKVREAASRAECNNNLKQLALATHQCNDTFNQMPTAGGYFPGYPYKEPAGPWIPGLPTRPGMGFGTLLGHLCPFIEQDNLIHSPATLATDGIYYYDGGSSVAGKWVKTFICPSDPSVGTVQSGADFSNACYAGNWLVFGVPYIGFASFGCYQSWSEIPKSFPDGLSNTILFAEKYAVCGLDTSLGATAIGGNTWTYNWGPGADPLFNVDWTGNATSLGPQSIFQVQPKWQSSSCDPFRASTSHPGGMNVALADGSVRVLSSAISPNTWWQAVQPADGSVLGSDW
jgi:prepilin-type processing-associated H-X9-DG protein